MSCIAATSCLSSCGSCACRGACKMAVSTAVEELPKCCMKVASSIAGRVVVGGNCGGAGCCRAMTHGKHHRRFASGIVPPSAGKYATMDPEVFKEPESSVGNITRTDDTGTVRIAGAGSIGSWSLATRLSDYVNRGSRRCISTTTPAYDRRQYMSTVGVVEVAKPQPFGDDRPSWYMREMPSDLIPFRSPKGRELLAKCLQGPCAESYLSLSQHFVGQQAPPNCGPATLAMVLNSLEIDPGRRWAGPWRWWSEDMLVSCQKHTYASDNTGVNFQQFAMLAECNGAKASTYYGSIATTEEFRQVVKDTLEKGAGDRRLVVSYDRQVMHQTGCGHYSPVAAYDEDTDLCLVMDVARFKYPPHWVPLPLLHKATTTIDNTTGMSRGFIVVGKGDGSKHDHMEPDPAASLTASCKYLSRPIPEDLSEFFRRDRSHATVARKFGHAVRGLMASDARNTVAALESVREDNLYRRISEKADQHQEHTIPEIGSAASVLFNILPQWGTELVTLMIETEYIPQQVYGCTPLVVSVSEFDQEYCEQGGYKAILRPWKGRELNQKALDEVMMVNSIWPKEFPFPEECFDKLDTSPDGEFYDIPKLDMHISKETAECVKGEYNRILPKEAQAHLELGAGVLSYFPDSYKPVKVTGYGMNMEEVNLNKVKDLNISPILEEESDSYDCVTLAFSVQYLTKPHLVLAEAYRILNSGGLLLISFTDRCFETKGIMPPRRRQPPRRAARRAASNSPEPPPTVAAAVEEDEEEQLGTSPPHSSPSTATSGARQRKGRRVRIEVDEAATQGLTGNIDEPHPDDDGDMTPIQAAKAILSELDKCLGESGTLTNVKRLYKLRHHLKNLHWHLAEDHGVNEEGNEEGQEEARIVSQLYKKLERCICKRIFHRNDNGIAFIACVLTMHPSFIVDAFAAIKYFMPTVSLSVLQGLSKALYRGWKESSGAMKRHMEQAIQAWMDYSLKVDPVLARRIRILLSEFHRKDRRPPELENLLVELYQPILWKQLTVTNWKIRLNAVATLGDAFPICNSTTNAGMERTMDIQVRALVSAMTDKHDQVRRIAVNKVCESLAIQWSLISTDHRSVLLYNVINKCAKDKRSAAVRMAVVQGMRRIISDCAMSHQIMGSVLPKIGEMIYDPSPQVRLEYCKLVEQVQGMEGINISDMTQGHQTLLQRLVIEHAYGMRKKEKFTQQDVKQATQDKDVYVQIACSLGSILGNNIFKNMDAKALRNLAKMNVNVFIALMANCREAEGATPIARITFAAALFRFGMDIISKEDERHESIREAAGEDPAVMFKLNHARVMLRGVAELLRAEDVQKILHFNNTVKKARAKKRPRGRQEIDGEDDADSIARQRDDFYQNYLTDYNMTKLLDPSRGCFIEAVEILRVLSPDAYKHVKDKVIRFGKSSSSNRSSSSRESEVNHGGHEEDEDFYYGMLRLASAWNVSKDAIANLAKRISACSAVLNGREDMRQEGDIITSSLKALNGPLKAVLELRLQPKDLMPLKDPVIELVEALLDHLPFGLPVESHNEICSAFSLGLYIFISTALQGKTTPSTAQSEDLLLDVFTEIGDRFRSMKPAIRRGGRAQDVADAAPLVHEMGHRYLRHLVTTVYLGGLSTGTAEARLYDIQRTLWEWVIASGWNAKIPVWKTVADLLHQMGFTADMSTMLVINSLQLNLEHVSTLHPKEDEELYIDKMAKVAATKYGYDAQFKEFLRKRVSCDDEDNGNACHERVWEAFKRVALGPPVNRSLAQLLNIEVDDIKAEDNKENDSRQVSVNSVDDGSITPTKEHGGSSCSNAVPEECIQSGAPTPVHGGREQELELASTTGGWQVLLHNDQFHTFDQVADIVHDMLGQVSRQDAFSAALKAHRYGESTLITAPQRSVAERWVKMLTDTYMDVLLRTVDARVSVIDTQLALRDALDVLDRNGTNSPESYKVFGKLFETCRNGGPDLVTAILADTDVMGSMLRNVVPRLQDIEDSEALQDCLSFLGLLVAEVPASDDDDDKRNIGEKLRNRCAEKMLELSKDGSEIVRLITKQDSDMYLLYEELRFIQSLHKRFPRIITSAVLEAPEVVASLVDLLKTCPAAFVRNECLSLVHNMVFGAADEAAGRGDTTTTAVAAAEQMQIFPMLAFQGVIEALFGIVLEEPVVSAGDVPVVALETNLRLLGHEKTRRFWRTGGRESAEWAVEVFRHALYPNHHQRQSADSSLFTEEDKEEEGEEEELKGIPDVATFNTVWPTLKLSMEILVTYWGSTAKGRTAQTAAAEKSEEKAYCVDLGLVDTITDQIDNFHLSDECRREFLSIVLSLLQSCGAITVEKLTSGSYPSLWKICSLMLQSPPQSLSFRCSLSSFIEKATDLPPSISTVLQNSLCVSFSARATAGHLRQDDGSDDDFEAGVSPTPGAWVVSHLRGLSQDNDDLLSRSAMHTNAWFSLQLVMNCVKGKNTQSQKMMAASALMPSLTGGYESLLTFIDKVFLSLANSLIETVHGDENEAPSIDDTSVWSKDPATLPTTVIAVLQTLLVFRIDGGIDDAISTEPIYIKVLEGLFRYDGLGKMDINGLASLLLGSCLKVSCANSDLATSIIESDIGIIPLYQAGATLLDTVPSPPLGTIAKRPTWYPSFFIGMARRAHQSAQRSLVEQTLRIRSSTKGNDEITKLRSLLEVQQKEVAKSKQEARDTVKVLADMSEQLSELRDTDTATLVKRIESLQKANTALTGEVDALKKDNENLSKSLVAERAAASRLMAESSYQMKALAGCYRDENLRVQKLMAQQRKPANDDAGDDSKPEMDGSSDREDLVNLIAALKRLCPSVLDILAAPIDEPISNGLPPGSGTISVMNDDSSDTPVDEH
ncbi:Condensin-2 complex subunit G2 [Perkinsus chesapeaki]|uniref:glutathione gamma-glutamylcysteinyltransferase n=1 Tax=Perkinsus chesapeaki TaxID=330153 RepID=A0A7J6MY21_PERCH|nr:Condensin-2 complex subunit G2 [Perkinsus chesapeaki]